MYVSRRLWPSPAAALVALTLAGCGTAGDLTLCGGPEVPQDTPPAPMVGDSPKITNGSELKIAGWRFPDTALLIDGVEAVPRGCERFWTATVPLPAEGDNTFSLVSASKSDNRSLATPLTVTRDTTAPAAPMLTDPADGTMTAAGTVTVRGSRDAGDAVRLNGRLLFPPDGTSAFSTEVALAAGVNTLNFTAVDAAGNASAASTLNLTRTSAATQVPRPVYPVAGTPVAPAALGLTAQFALFWSDVTDPNVDHFRAQIATGPAFDTIVYDDTTGNAITLTLVPPDLPVGAYVWRVASVDAGGTPTFSRGVPFTVGPLPSDVDGDGYADVIAGVPGWDGGKDVRTQDNRGRVHLFLGGAAFGTTLEESPDLYYDGMQPEAQFGIAVTAGDLNGDGYADVIVGAHRDRELYKAAGRVFIYFGGAVPDTDPDLVLDGQNFDDGFGVVVASGFDLNADGYDDLAVDAWQHDGDTGDTADSRGRVYVFLGGAVPDAVPDMIMTGGETFENFGVGLAGGFDINGDGYGDLAIGGPIATTGGGTLAGAGRVLVYYGGPWADATADLTLEGTQAGEHFGSSVTALGDMDGDGFGDLAVGSPAYAVGGDVSRGRAQVFRGGLVPVAAAALEIDGAGGCEGFGTRVSGGRDVNGDGFADLVVGAPFSDLAGGNGMFCANMVGDYGTVELHFGAAVLNATPDARFTGAAANDWLGLGLHVSADTNGDLLPDVVMGAPNNDEGSNVFGDVGRGYVLFGRAGPMPWAAQQSVATINQNPAVPGAVLPNDGGKEGMGGAIW